MGQKELYSTDALTGLWDRLSVKSQVQHFLLEDFGTGQHALLIMDIDNFKSLNEERGRVFGNTMIQVIADEIRGCLSESDLAGRVGGDKFLIFLKNRKREEVIEMARRLNQVFHDRCAEEGTSVRVTGSIGISFYPKDGKTYDELFYKAEEAMYVMKSRGKNWYHFYTGEEDSEIHVPTKSGRYHFDSFGRFEDAGEYERQITAFAFDILASARDFATGMNLLLDKIGKNYDLNRIHVMRISYENRAFEGLYLWQNKELVMSEEPRTYGHFATLEDLREGFGESGVIVIDNVREDLMLSDMYHYAAELKITAFVACGIYNDDNKMIGYISFEMENGERKWSKEERDTFCFLTKIITHFLLVHADSRKNDQRIERLTNYDQVTGLYLYTNFKNEMARVMAMAQPGSLAIVNSDISNFKYINDTYGLEVGDKILQSFAKKTIIANRYCIAGCRVYADNFLALVRTSGKERLSATIVQFNEEFEREQKLLYPNSSFRVHTGAYIIENMNMKPEEILDCAGLAKNLVKEKRNLKYAFFDDSMKEMMLREGKVLAEVKTAILQRHLVPYLQPKFSLETNEVIGAEALVRWCVDEKIFYYPNDFIPVLEKSGNITDVDFCIYHQVMEWMRRWLDEGRKVVPISVNISRVDCRQQNLEQILIDMADRYQIPHQLIEIELTESAFFENADILMEKLAALRKAGFIISIDDFGSGYSSLSVISRMPIDVIKMDQSFLRSGLLSESSAYVIEAMIHLAERMNLGIICEGVETKEQVEFLLKCGCRMGQGYIFAKPMPVKQFEERYL